MVPCLLLSVPYDSCKSLLGYFPMEQPSLFQIEGQAKQLASRIELLDRPCIGLVIRRPRHSPNCSRCRDLNPTRSPLNFLKDRVEASLHSLYNTVHPKSMQAFFHFFLINFRLDIFGAHPVATQSQ